MPLAELAQLAQILHNRRSAIADQWYRAVAPISFTPLESGQVRQRLDDLTQQVITLLLAERFDRDTARSMGVALAHLCHAQPECLAATLQALAQHLIVELPAETAMRLYPQLTTLLNELAAGFSAEAIEMLRAEQEQIRQPLIAERLQAEEALRKNEALYRAIVEDQTELIGRFSPGGALTFVNEAYSRYFGARPEELMGDDFMRVFLDDDRARVDKHLASLGRENPVATIEARTVMPDGQIRWQQWTSRAIFDEQGCLIEFQSVGRDVTERKQVEAKLYEAETRYRTLVEQIPAITYIAALDEASTTLYNSPQIETILGFSPAEYQANPDMWRERLHPDDRERVLAEVARSHVMGEPLVSDYRMLARDGHVVWFHDEAVLVRNVDGRPLFLQGVMLDITERKRIEMTLQESELRYRSLVETSPDAIVLVDLDFRRLLCNRQDAVLHGYESTEEMIGRNALDLVAPEDLPRAMGYVRQGRETGSIRNVELTLLKKDGTRFAAEISGSTITNIDGQPQFLMTVVRDITERKQAEESQRENEERLRFVLEGSQLGFWDWNLEVGEVRRNERWAEMLGYTLPEIEFTVKQWTDLIHPDDRAAAWQSIQDHLEGRTPVHEIEIRMLTKDGQYRWILDRGGIVKRDPQGRPLRMSGTHADITEQRQMRDLLVRHAQEMEALYNTSLEINSQPDVPVLLQAIVQRAASLVGTQMGGLYLIKPDGQTLELVVSYNLPGDYLGVTLHLGEGLAGCVAQTGKPMAIEDYIHWEERAAAYANAPFRRVLGVPLRVRDTVIGVIDVVDDKTVGPFGEDEIRLVSLFADQAAIAIENARLYQAEREQRELAETLREVGATLVSTLDANTVLDGILEQVSRVVPNDAADILLIEGDRAHFAGWRGYERFGIVDLTSVTLLVAGTRNLQQMVETGEPVVIPDVHADLDWFPVPGTERLCSYAGVPIRVRGETIGFLAVCSVTPGCFEWRDAERLRAFADQAAIALENARLYQAERKQRELAETMREISAALASTLDMDIVLDRLLANVSRIVPNEAADIMLVEGDHAHFVRWRGYERFGIRDLAHVAFPIADRPHLQQMIQTCGPVFVSDTHADPNWGHVPSMGWLRSYAGTPICVRGEAIGFLDVASTQPGAFGQLHAERLRAFADQAAIALENARLFEQVRDTAGRLQALSLRLVEVQETERRQIARELHDEIGQIVTGLKLRLEMSSRLPDDALRDSLGEAKDLVHELLERVRELSLDLRPAMLDDLGLLPALLWLFERFTAQADVGVAFKHSGMEHRRFSSEVETAAYRIVQEALTNIARHASASTVTVRLWVTPDTLGVQVEDDGAGFSPERVLIPGTSSGLSNMRERADMLGGKLEIESSSGAGTRVTAELPLDHPA